MENNKADRPANTILIGDHATPRSSPPVAPLRVSGQPSELEPGSAVGNYVILDRIGEGGMGVVYKAQDAHLDRTVALKVLPPQLFRNHQFLQRFRTEAQAQARLNSPNVVTLYSMLEIPAGLVLVMEYVEGETLSGRLRRLGPLEVDEAVWIFTQALQGVEHAHALGIVHRDLKPENIFITDAHEVKLMDFGVAKIMDHGDGSLAGAMMGTLLYIAPEQVNGKDADFRSDIYTLGVSLFEAITGRLPFERKTDYGLMHAHVLEKPPSPRKMRRGLPVRLEAIILKAIEKDPMRRFQSAREFREALLKHGRRGLSSDTLTGRAGSGRRASAWLFPLRRREDAPRRGLMSRLGVELALLAGIAALVVALGLYPVREAPVEAPLAGWPGEPATTTGTADAAEPGDTETASAAADVAADAGAATSSPAAERGGPGARRAPARHARASQDSGAREPRRAARPARDKYDVLRRAWGGG